jgi:hypothetical protein
MSRASAARCGASTIVAQYQVDPQGVASVGIGVPGVAAARPKIARPLC